LIVVELNADAAYIRKSTTDANGLANANIARPQMEREVLELLRSAHTVESLNRRIAGDRRAEVTSVSHEVAAAMRQLLQQDLIGLSPDS
jgi:hypothetical protein